MDEWYRQVCSSILLFLCPGYLKSYDQLPEASEQLDDDVVGSLVLTLLAFLQLPPVTRVYVSLCFVTTAACALEVQILLLFAGEILLC